LAADGAVSIRAALRDGRAALAERAELLATIQADALAVSMWDLDDAKIEAGIAALALDPDFRAARLRAADGSLLAERGSPGHDGSEVLRAGREVVYPDSGGPRVLGVIELELSRAGSPPRSGARPLTGLPAWWPWSARCWPGSTPRSVR
jgi:hypothetical protein